METGNEREWNDGREKEKQEQQKKEIWMACIKSRD